MFIKVSAFTVGEKYINHVRVSLPVVIYKTTAEEITVNALKFRTPGACQKGIVQGLPCLQFWQAFCEFESR